MSKIDHTPRGEDGLTQQKRDRIARRAARWANKGLWDLSEKNRQEIKERLLGVVRDPQAPNREAIQSSKVLADCQKQDVDVTLKVLDLTAEENKPAQVTNQQINIYLPSNGRDITSLPNTNGHVNGNGKH